jgi:predicted permease
LNIVLLKAITFILLILIGYVFKKIGIFSEESHTTIMKVVTTVTLPAAIITSFSHYEHSIDLLFVVLLGFGLNWLMSAVGYLMAFKKGRAEKAYNIINYSGYNVGTFAMPYLQSFLGDSVVLTACLFDTGNSIMCTGGVNGIAAIVSGKQRVNIKRLLKKLLSSVPFDVYVGMLILSVMGIKFPDEIITITSTIGNANAVMAMLMIGTAFELKFNKKDLKSVSITIAIRYALSAVVAFVIYTCLPVSAMLKQVLTVIVFSPISAMTIVFTEENGGDVSKSAFTNSISMIISIIIITVLMNCFTFA